MGPRPYGGTVMLLAERANSILLMHHPITARYFEPRWNQTIADQTVKFKPNPNWTDDIDPPLATDYWNVWLLREPVTIYTLSRRPAVIDRMAVHPAWSPLGRPPYRVLSRL